MRSFTRLLPITALALASTAFAQLGAPRPAPSWPGGGHRLDVQAVLQQALGQGHDGVLGCAKDTAGHYYVTVARSPAQSSHPHLLVELDAAGQFLAAYPQPAALQASPWGMRDLAFDGIDTLFGGAELAVTGPVVFAFDTVQKVWAPQRNWTVPANLPLATLRGLAYVPNGASGAGSLFAVDWYTEAIEFDRAGMQLRSVLAPDMQGVFGLAHDQSRNTLWWFGQHQSENPLGSTVAPGYVHLHETGIASPYSTGQRCLGERDLPGGAWAAGCEFFVENGRPTLLLLHQSASDTLCRLDPTFVQAPGCGGDIALDAYGNSAYPGAPLPPVIALTNSVATAAALCFSPYRSAGTSLPAPFAAGCQLDLAAPIATGNLWPGQGALEFAWIPADPSLAGIDTWWQWAEFDAGNGRAYTSSLGALRIK